MRWRRVRRVTTRLAMTFVTFAARASAGIPPPDLGRTTGKHHEPGPGATNGGETCPGCGARVSGQFCEACGFSPWTRRPFAPRPRRPSLSRRFREASRERSPRPASCPVGGRVPVVRLISRTTRIAVPAGLQARSALLALASAGAVTFLVELYQILLPPLAASRSRRPPRRSSPPGRRSPNHQRSPRLRTCWHRYSHRLLRPVLNRHSRSWLPSNHPHTRGPAGAIACGSVEPPPEVRPDPSPAVVLDPPAVPDPA